MFKIVTVPNKILRTPTKPVLIIDSRITKIVQEMVDTLKNLDHPKGVGLAANQVGINLSIFVFRHQDEIRPVINPKILWHSHKEVLDIRNKHTMLEGCLSIPFHYGTIKRFASVKISYWDLDGKICEEKFGMPQAVVVQHEIDHLKGKLFIDRLLAQKGKLYKVERNKGGEEMVEVEI